MESGSDKPLLDKLWDLYKEKLRVSRDVVELSPPCLNVIFTKTISLYGAEQYEVICRYGSVILLY